MTCRTGCPAQSRNVHPAAGDPAQVSALSEAAPVVLP